MEGVRAELVTDPSQSVGFFPSDEADDSALTLFCSMVRESIPMEAYQNQNVWGGSLD